MSPASSCAPVSCSRYRRFGGLYVPRYWALLDRLSPKAVHGTALTTSVTDDQKALAMYIRLGEDQLGMRKAGAITTGTYEQWRDGMLAAAQEIAVRRRPAPAAG